MELDIELQTIVDSTDANNVYYGYAELGRGTDQAFWKIQRITTDSNIVTKYFPVSTRKKMPSSDFEFAWENRAVLNYSLVEVDEVVAPTILSATRNDDTTITVTLSELALATSITKANAGGFTVFQTGTPGTAYVVSAISPGLTDDLVELTVANVSASDLVGLTVTYSDTGNGTIVDLEGNHLLTNSTLVLIPSWDDAPTMVSAERLANTSLKVTCTEDLDSTSVTKANAGGFIVHEIGAPATTYAVSSIARNGINHNKIELTVADMTASAAVGVTIKYTAGGNGTVADLLLNLMVTDSTGVNAPAWA